MTSDHHLIGWSIAFSLILVFICLGVWIIHKARTSKNRAAYAGMLLLFGSFLRIDPPPEPKAEHTHKDMAGGDPGDVPTA